MGDTKKQGSSKRNRLEGALHRAEDVNLHDQYDVLGMREWAFPKNGQTHMFPESFAWVNSSQLPFESKP